MNSPSAFTPDEWSLIQTAPMLVFYCVAKADDGVEKEEVERLIRHFGNPTQYNSELLTKAIASLMSAPERLEEIGKQVLNCDSQAVYRQIADVQVLVDGSLELDAAEAFKNALVMLGTDIAAASGETSLPVSKEEWVEVTKLKQLLKL